MQRCIDFIFNMKTTTARRSRSLVSFAIEREQRSKADTLSCPTWPRRGSWYRPLTYPSTQSCHMMNLPSTSRSECTLETCLSGVCRAERCWINHTPTSMDNKSQCLVHAYSNATQYTDSRPMKIPHSKLTYMQYCRLMLSPKYGPIQSADVKLLPKKSQMLREILEVRTRGTVTIPFHITFLRTLQADLRSLV